MTNLVFMGSPQFAVPTLEVLARDHAILAVFTQPDKPAGRGQRLTAVPVKQWAVARDIPVHQPKSFRKEPQAIDVLRDLKPEVIVVAAYGLILPQAVLDMPPFGCLNVHGSILPRHRGAAPITSAILMGDAETGITIMQMDAGMDTGPMLSVAREAIRPDDTTASLGERMSYLGAQLMADTLPKYLSGEMTLQPQPEEGVTYSPKINKADAQIDWRKPATEIERMVRAYIPWPGTFTFWDKQMMKVLKTQVKEGQRDGETGRVVQLNDGSIGVVTGEGLLVLKEIQLAGRKAMKAEDFVRGQPKFIGAVLG
ncbi:MAG TPA: methionyl-tRNA formyltransferase [Anaerolineae bacterium]|nr:methionyl-tRNA formyltransferase [Anaerolineae bacterium]